MLALLTSSDVSVTSAASSSVGVSITVRSATSFNPAACQTSSPATSFGAVLPGSSSISSAACSIAFGSTNDTAMLRVSQQDGYGAAMWQAAGVPDSAFGTNGVAITDITGTAKDDNLYGTPVAAQPDGKIVVVGSTVSGYNDVSVVRYDENGAPDLSFDGDPAMACFPCNGKLLFRGASEDYTDETANGVALLTSGKILIAGGQNDAHLWRLNADGSRDATWGPNGLRTYSSGLFGIAHDLIVHPDGAITMLEDVYTGGDLDMGILHLLPDGSLDPNFDGDPTRSPCYPCNGHVLFQRTAVANDGDYALGVALQSTGKLLIAGAYTAAGNTNSITRFTTTGAVDPTFGSGGFADIDTGGGLYGRFEAISVLPDDRIVAAGWNQQGGDEWTVARLQANGAPDNTFDGDSIQVIDFGPASDKAIGLVAMADGTALVSGTVTAGSETDVGFARLTPAGAVDTTFGASGRMTIDIGQDDAAVSSTLGVDGRVLTAIRSRSSAAATWDLGASVLKGDVVSDWQSGSADWSAGANAFGACLATTTGGVGGGGVNGWTVAGSGNCTTALPGNWQAIPASSAGAGAKVASSLGTGGSGTANLQFGLRLAAAQKLGSYFAPITFEVLAPNA